MELAHLGVFLFLVARGAFLSFGVFGRGPRPHVSGGEGFQVGEFRFGVERRAVGSSRREVLLVVSDDPGGIGGRLALLPGVWFPGRHAGVGRLDFRDVPHHRRRLRRILVRVAARRAQTGRERPNDHFFRHLPRYHPGGVREFGAIDLESE